MPKAPLYNISGEKIGEVDLRDDVFGIAPHEAAMAEMVKHHLAARRQGTQSTLTRAEVRGGGRKPWRQKGTGHARQGSTRAPQWTHGGIAFGPKPRKYRYSVNKKVRRLAFISALSAKAASGEIYVIDSLNLSEIKTKTFKTFLETLQLGGAKTLVVTPEVRENVYKSARNLVGVTPAVAGAINVYDILGHTAFVADRAVITKYEEVYGK